MNRRHVSDAHDQVQQALYDYTLNCYSHVPVSSWNSAFCFVFHGAHWLFFACLFFSAVFCIRIWRAQQEKFAKMMAIMPDIHAMSSRGEEYLYFKHLNGCAPTQTLLMEMLHAKRK